MKLLNHIVPVLCATFVALSPMVMAAQEGAKSPAKERDNLRPVAKNKAEADAFNELFGIQDPDRIIAATDAFMAAYGASQLTGEAMGLRMDAFLMQKKIPEALDELAKVKAFNDKFVEDRTKEATNRNSPALEDLRAYKEERLVGYYRRMTEAAQSLQVPAIAEYFGNEVLARFPTDFPTLLTVARVKAQNPPKEPKEDRDKILTEAEAMAQYAVNYVVAYLNSPNSAQLKPEQRNEWAYRAHSLMGLIYNQQQRYADAEKAYMVALNYKKDGSAYYYLGYAYYSEKKFEAAIDAAQKSVFLKGPLESGAKDLLRVLYRETKRSMADIDKDIQLAGERMGKL